MNQEIKYIRNRIGWLKGLVPILKEKKNQYKDKQLDYCRAEILGSVEEIEKKLKKLEKKLK